MNVNERVRHSRRNNRLRKPHSTFAIRAKPEIGFAAGGAGCCAGTVDWWGGAGDAAAEDVGGASACAAAVDPPSFANCAFRLLANCVMICAAVIWIMPTPRPYWATAPESVRLVCTSTLVPPLAGSRWNAATALAAPRPLASLPWAATRA